MANWHSRVSARCRRSELPQPLCALGAAYAVLGGADSRSPPPLVDVLTKHDINAVGISNLELPDLVRTIRRLLEYGGSAIPDLAIVLVNVTYPLEEMDAGRRRLVTSRQVNRRV